MVGRQGVRQVFSIDAQNATRTINRSRLAGNFVYGSAHNDDIKLLANGGGATGAFCGAWIEVLTVVFCDD
jgi:hypothetical protein